MMFTSLGPSKVNLVKNGNSSEYESKSDDSLDFEIIQPKKKMKRRVKAIKEGNYANQVNRTNQRSHI